MKKSTIVTLVILCIAAIALFVVMYFVFNKSKDYRDYTEDDTPVTSMSIEDNPNVRESSDDFLVKDDVSIQEYAESIHDGNIVGIYEVLITSSATYYTVNYEDGFSADITYANGEYSFVETPTSLELEETD